MRFMSKEEREKFAAEWGPALFGLPTEGHVGDLTVLSPWYDPESEYHEQGERRVAPLAQFLYGREHRHVLGKIRLDPYEGYEPWEMGAFDAQGKPTGKVFTKKDVIDEVTMALGTTAGVEAEGVMQMAQTIDRLLTNGFTPTNIRSDITGMGRTVEISLGKDTLRCMVTLSTGMPINPLLTQVAQLKADWFINGSNGNSLEWQYPEIYCTAPTGELTKAISLQITKQVDESHPHFSPRPPIADLPITATRINELTFGSEHWEQGALNELILAALRALEVVSLTNVGRNRNQNGATYITLGGCSNTHNVTLNIKL